MVCKKCRSEHVITVKEIGRWVYYALWAGLAFAAFAAPMWFDNLHAENHFLLGAWLGSLFDGIPKLFWFGMTFGGPLFVGGLYGIIHSEPKRRRRRRHG